MISSRPIQFISHDLYTKKKTMYLLIKCYCDVHFSHYLYILRESLKYFWPFQISQKTFKKSLQTLFSLSFIKVSLLKTKINLLLLIISNQLWVSLGPNLDIRSCFLFPRQLYLIERVRLLGQIETPIEFDFRISWTCNLKSFVWLQDRLMFEEQSWLWSETWICTMENPIEIIFPTFYLHRGRRLYH